MCASTPFTFSSRGNNKTTTGATVLNNRYQLGAELGRGGMGRVHHGSDLLLNRSVAVKVLSKTGLGSEDQLRRLAEAQFAARLNHPNIVTVYDAGDVDGVPFIVIELITGQALDYAGLICAALAHAHQNGVIHCDQKPPFYGPAGFAVQGNVASFGSLVPKTS